MGHSKTKTTQIKKRDPEPSELKNLRMGLFNKIYPGLESFDTETWKRAQELANKALTTQDNLLSQLPNSLEQSNNAVQEILNTARTGNIPSGVMERLNATVNRVLQSGMGNMLNSLANRGVLTSSVTNAGTNQLLQAAADAFNRNYLSAYQAVLGGLCQWLQASQNNTASLLSGLQGAGNVPSQVDEGIGAQ